MDFLTSSKLALWALVSWALAKKSFRENSFVSSYYTDSDVFLADSVDLADISDFFADILTFFHDGC